VKKTLLLLATTATMTLASTGAELLEKKCASCHMLESPKPEQLSTLKAPAMDAVVLHINLAMQKDIDKKVFIADYVFNPKVGKSVCESNKVSQFGVMPSQKGKVTAEELELISTEMLKTYPRKSFVAMIKEMQSNGKINALTASPFLLNNEETLPHMTKLLLENWDKTDLGLTVEQKEKLLAVRKATLSAVKKIKKQIKPLEDEVVEVMIEKILKV